MRACPRVVFLIAIAACGGPSKSTSTTPAPPAGNGSAAAPPAKVASMTCEAAISNTLDLSVAEAPDADRAGMKQQLDAVKPKMIAACEEDHWSAELLSCLGDAKASSATDRCTDLMTKDQQENLSQRMMAQ